MTWPKAIRVGRKWIGEGHPCFIVAEIGINHNGDLKLAKKLIRAAKKAGADAVKFQNYRTEDFLSNRRAKITYKSQGEEITESQWDLFKRCEPKEGWLEELKALCDSLKLIFFSTPTSQRGVEELVRLKAPLLKNGSDYLTHTPLIAFMAKTGIPVVLSTGMATQEEVDSAVEAVRKEKKSPLILLHCTSLYPTPKESTNLRRMVALRDRYKVPVGFSDHTIGSEAACQAVTLGACLIEKHFTMNHNFPGPDHWFSATPQELAQLVQEVRDAEARLGRGAIAPDPQEKEARKAFQVSLVASRNLSKGERLKEDMVKVSRPGGGLHPKRLRDFLGKKLKKNTKKGEPLRAEFFL